MNYGRSIPATMKIQMASLALLLICVHIQLVMPMPKSGMGYYPYAKSVKYPAPFPTAVYPSVCQHKFVCSSTYGDCINGELVCNGRPDCANGMDEQDCGPICGNENKMSCSDRKTCGIFCDGEKQCPGGEDERDCPDSCFCPEGNYLCKNSKKCIPKSRLCDGTNDCPMDDDEWECSDVCKCGEGHYLCEDGVTCILGKKVCDGAEQCPHGDDEIDCPHQCFCGAGSFICSLGDVCVPYDLLCEDATCADTTDWDCPLGEDELLDACNCPV